MSTESNVVSIILGGGVVLGHPWMPGALGMRDVDMPHNPSWYVKYHNIYRNIYQICGIIKSCLLMTGERTTHHQFGVIHHKLLFFSREGEMGCSHANKCIETTCYMSACAPRAQQ